MDDMDFEDQPRAVLLQKLHEASRVMNANAELRDKLTRFYKLRISDLQTDLATTKRALLCNNAKSKELSAKSDILGKKERESAERMANYEHKITEQQDQIDFLEKRVSSYIGQASFYKRSIDGLRTEYANYLQRYADTKARAEKYECEALQNKIDHTNAMIMVDDLQEQMLRYESYGEEWRAYNQVMREALEQRGILDEVMTAINLEEPQLYAPSKASGCSETASQHDIIYDDDGQASLAENNDDRCPSLAENGESSYEDDEEEAAVCKPEEVASLQGFDEEQVEEEQQEQGSDMCDGEEEQEEEVCGHQLSASSSHYDETNADEDLNAFLEAEAEHEEECLEGRQDTPSDAEPESKFCDAEMQTDCQFELHSVLPASEFEFIQPEMVNGADYCVYFDASEPTPIDHPVAVVDINERTQVDVGDHPTVAENVQPVSSQSRKQLKAAAKRAKRAEMRRDDKKIRRSFTKLYELCKY